MEVTSMMVVSIVQTHASWAGILSTKPSIASQELVVLGKWTENNPKVELIWTTWFRSLQVVSSFLLVFVWLKIMCEQKLGLFLFPGLKILIIIQVVLTITVVVFRFLRHRTRSKRRRKTLALKVIHYFFILLWIIWFATNLLVISSIPYKHGINIFSGRIAINCWFLMGYSKYVGGFQYTNLACLGRV